MTNSPKLMEYFSVKPYLLSFDVCLYGICVKLADENMSYGQPTVRGIQISLNTGPKPSAST